MAFKTLPTSSGDADHAEIMAEINITPLVDVVLVLLIIFMVTSSVMSQMGMEVSLPKASAASAGTQPEGVIVTLLPDGGMKVNGNAVDGLAGLERSVGEALPKTTGRMVVLEGDQKAFLGNAIQVMDAARRAGAEKFAIATTPEK
jgi:biopolymer transport protein ExbD